MSINVTRSSMPDFEEYCDEIRDLWDSRWLTNAGVKHQALERALEEYLKVPQVSLYTNGHLALEAALSALKLPAGGEVITTPFTFASTTNAIVRAGLKPVFADIREEDFTIDPFKLTELITPNTVAIFPVHVYGNLCDTDMLAAIADETGLKLIYDAAHAFGVSYNGTSAACFGDISMFSFHATKVFNTIEGGALCYKDASLRPVLESERNFGLSGEDASFAGGNAKMNEFQAAMGLCNLRHLDGEIAKRKAVVERYRENLGGTPGLRLKGEQQGVTSNYAYFPVVFEGYKETRDEVFDKLKNEDINARKYFYPTTNSFSYIKKLCGEDAANGTPIAARLSRSVLTLPLYADLALEDVDRICEIILK